MKKLLVVVTLALAGCGSGPPLRDYNPVVPFRELSATPFFPQDEFQCGPAALATVLGASGIAISPEALTPQIYLPGRQGSLQAEIIAATRRHGRLPYILRPGLDNLLAEVANGTPVLVMQNLALKHFPQWHYAVVIGFDTVTDTLLLRSGTDERMVMKRSRFASSWVLADRWAMVASAVDTPPITANHGDWLQAANAFEELGQMNIALQAYLAATRRWPMEALPWKALGNAYYASDELAKAEGALRQALLLAPSAAGYNNLAHVLQKRGCPTEAARHIQNAQGMADAAGIRDILAATQQAIDNSNATDDAACAELNSTENRP